MPPKVGVIGLGRMGKALLKGILRSGRFTILGYDISTDIKDFLGKPILKKIQLVPLSEIQKEPITTIIAVKPPQVGEVIKQFTDARLIISSAAGVPLEHLDEYRRVPGPTIRIMPNQPVQIGEGVIAYSCNERTTEKEKTFFQTLFARAGELIPIEEYLMDGITAISGSGPAYVYSMLSALEQAGILLGIPHDLARKIATLTVIGSAMLGLKNSSLSWEKLTSFVTSPGGITIEALKRLKKEGWEGILMEAIQKAFEKAKKLEKEKI